MYEKLSSSLAARPLASLMQQAALCRHRAYVQARCATSWSRSLDFTTSSRADIQVFTPHELKLFLTGKPRLEVDDLIACTRYTGGYERDSPTVELFWELLRSFNDEQKSALLEFITGASRIPLDGLDPVLTITKASDRSESSLPLSHTCFNQIVLPVYKTLQIMREKTVYAMQNAAGFHMT